VNSLFAGDQRKVPWEIKLPLKRSAQRKGHLLNSAFVGRVDSDIGRSDRSNKLVELLSEDSEGEEQVSVPSDARRLTHRKN